MNIEPHPDDENFEVHAIYDCKDCSKEIRWPKDKKRE